MLRNWSFLFIIVPLIELYLIIEVGSHIGALWTVFLVVGTAVIGVRLLKIQGINTLKRAQQNMNQGTIPAMEMMEGMALAVGGALLITPGFITDTIGFLCLIPASRKVIVRYLLARSTVHMHGFQEHRHQKPPSKQSKGNTIEGEFHKED